MWVPVERVCSVTPSDTDTTTAVEATFPATTRYCVFAARPSSLKTKVPLASVSSGFPRSTNPAVYGNCSAWSCTGALALPVPESVPSTVTAPPTATGFGAAVIASASGIFAVTSARPVPSAVPLAFVATIR